MKSLLSLAVTLTCFLICVGAKPASGPATLPATRITTEFQVESLLNRDGPHLRVQVAMQRSISNWMYDLHVTTTDGVDQHLSMRNGVMLSEDRVKLVDVTADGFLDLMIVGGKDHRGEDWFKTWLYDPKTKQYKWINDR